MALSKATFLSVALFAAASAGGTTAGTIEHEATPLKRADVEIDFWEHGFLGGQAITDQFQNFGVSFSGQMRWVTRIQKRRGARGATLANFDYEQEMDTANPFSVKFDYLVNEVTFGLSAYNSMTRITALLRGREVGFFETTVNADRVEDNQFGFEGIRLDEILIDFGGNHWGSTFDTLHYNHARNRRGDLIESGVPAVRYRTMFTEPEPTETASAAANPAPTGASGVLSSSGSASNVSAVTAVPLPAAFWMLLMGVGGMVAGGLRRRRKEPRPFHLFTIAFGWACAFYIRVSGRTYLKVML